ncbi:MAG: U-box domain-containing protein [Parachlamydiaceae bacterium]
MKVVPQNFSQLNAYLEKIEYKLHSSKNKELAPLMMKVDKAVNEHFHVVNGSDLKEVARFLNSIKRIDALGGKQGVINQVSTWFLGRTRERGLVGVAIEAIAATSGSLSLDKIQGFKEIDDNLYYESLAKYIDENKVPIASLRLSREEMIKVAPWLTHLELTDTADPEVFNTRFIYDLLKSASNLETFIIQNHSFDPKSDRCFNKKNLKHLEVVNCPNFLPDLKKFQSLESLKIEGSIAFNQSVNQLKQLRELEVSHCIHFNQSLDGLEHLVRVKISECPVFEVNDLSTARILKKLYLELLLDPKANISYELQEELLDDTLTHIEEQMNVLDYSSFDIRADLAYLFLLHIPPEYLAGFYRSFPLSAELFSLFKLYSHYHEEGSGLNMVSATELLDEREKTITQLENFNALKVLEQLPLDCKMTLLPFFTPDQIGEAIAAVSRETITRWLGAPVASHYFHGEMVEVFAEVENEHIQGTNQETRNDLLLPLTDLVTTTPFYTLAALAHDDPEVMLSYTFVMDEPQMACIIPSINVDAFVEHLKEQPIQTHRDYLMHASTPQKTAYIDEDLLAEPESLAEWDQSVAHIEDRIRNFKTKEDYQQLEKAWDEMVHSTTRAVQTYQQTCQTLEAVLLKFSPDQAFEDKVIAYLQPKMERATEVLQSLKDTGKKIEALESKVPGLVKIPEEFIDIITEEPMTDPYHHPSTPNYILDKSTWNMLETHPTTRAPINQDELVPNSELKAEIEALKKLHPELWDE